MHVNLGGDGAPSCAPNANLTHQSQQPALKKMEACISVRGDLFSAVAQSGARRRRKLFLMNTVNAVNASLVFTQCVETINRGHDGNYQQANRWLSEFKYDPNAWGTLVDLINQSSNSDVLFHAANIANSKAKNEWSNINDDVRRSLVQVVRCVLRNSSENRRECCRSEHSALRCMVAGSRHTLVA